MLLFNILNISEYLNLIGNWLEMMKGNKDMKPAYDHEHELSASKKWRSKTFEQKE